MAAVVVEMGPEQSSAARADGLSSDPTNFSNFGDVEGFRIRDESPTPQAEPAEYGTNGGRSAVPSPVSGSSSASPSKYTKLHADSPIGSLKHESRSTGTPAESIAETSAAPSVVCAAV
jgi:hypothetical protein